MLIALKLSAFMSCHLGDDGIWDALHEKDCRGEVPQIVDAQILDDRPFTYSPEPLAQIPYMRLLEVSGKVDVWLRREQVLATTEAGLSFNRVNRQ